MFENTTRLQATDPIFCTIWKHNKIFRHIWKYNKIFSREETFELLKTPNMWQCSRIPQDCRPRGKAKVVEATQWFRFLKVPQNCQQPRKFNLLKPPKRQCSTGKNLSSSIWSHPQGNVWKYHKIAGHGPNILHSLKTQQNISPYLKIQQDFQPRGNIWIIEDTKYVTMFENTTRLQATGKS